MISAKRMVAIFRSGGGARFANLSESLTADQIAHLEDLAGDEAVIAKISADDEWLVVTKSRLVFRRKGKIRRILFDDIRACAIPRADPRNTEEWRKRVRVKRDGGDLEIGLKDGTKFHLKVEPGGPYFGLQNVLMRIAASNRRRDTQVRPGNGTTPPTTND